MKLRDAAAALLADLTHAQHRTNELSKRLSSKYRDDRLLRFFPVPNALLDEAVVTLHFALREAAAEAAEPASETAPQHSGEAHPHLALRLARSIVAPVCANLARHLRGGSDPHAGPRQKLADALVSESVVHAFAHRLQPPLHAFVERAVSSEAPDDLVEATLPHLAPALAGALREDEDLAAHVLDLDAVVAEAFNDSLDVIRETLVHGAASAQALAALPAEIPQIEVILDGPALAQLPEHAIQTLTLKARLRQHQWTVVEREGAAVAEDLVPKE
jgi:hypothetical protein